jgi:membrane fusion protein (multidrug efflux system)
LKPCSREQRRNGGKDQEKSSMSDQFMGKRIRDDQTVLCGLQAKDGATTDRDERSECVSAFRRDNISTGRNQMTVYLRPFITLPLLVFLLVACEKQQAPSPQGPPAAVTVVTLKTEPVTLSRQLPGRTNPFVVAEVRPQVTGIVKERLFSEGSLVKAGQALYQLDDATYRASYNSAKALLARAEASVEIARFNADRAEELIKTNAVSKQDLLNAQAEKRQAEADVGVAQAHVASVQVKLSYARITSPIDGRIGKSTVTRGALVTADQVSPLTTVQQLDPIYVDLTRSANELLELRRELSSGVARRTTGIPVTILFEDSSPYEHEGELTFTDVAVDPRTGSYALRVVVPNPDNLLMPGMYVRAIVSNAVLDRGLLVPQRGIGRDAKGNARAMVVNRDGTVEQRAVQVSRTVSDHWLVNGGLNEGDRVIVEGLQKVRPGMTVTVTEAETDNSSAISGAPGEEESSSAEPSTDGEPGK